MVRIKICGLTNWDDARLAVELGATAIGFVFAKSPRQVQPPKVREIVAKLPPFVSRVGVFLNHQEKEVKEIADFCHLDVLQFHGQETPSYCKQFKHKIIKAFPIRTLSDLEALSLYEVDAFLLDTYDELRPGGTGKTFDWNLAIRGKEYGRPIILSGGLNPENVAKAIKMVHPFAVDVSSGVEAMPGKKDPERLKAFFEAVRRANKVIK